MPDLSKSELHKVVAAWQSSWTSLDPDIITDLYAEDAEHMSNVVTQRMGLGSGTLKSRAAIRLYVEESVKRLTSFRADIISVIMEDHGTEGCAAVEYWRTLNGNDDKRSRVFELLEWRNDKLTSCRVYHF